MIKVMVVEDEPAAMSYIVSLINSRCSGMEIVAQAEDGSDAIKLLENTQVDILITDVQMTHMSGVELAHWVNAWQPDVTTLIISGHSDFEYAKGALQAGVAEYLLKPIKPATFVETMEKLYVQAVRKRRIKRERWLRQAAAGTSERDPFPGTCPDEPILMGVLVLGAGRKHSLPPGDGFAYPGDSAGDVAATYIHRDNEICFALPVGNEAASPDEPVAVLAAGAPYHTALFKVAVTGEQDVLPEMLRAARNIAISGVSQLYEYSETLLEEQKPSRAEQTLVKQLRYYVVNAQLDKLKEGIEKLFEQWRSEKCRLKSVETTLTRLIQFMAENAPPGHGISQQDIAEKIPLICRGAADLSDMLSKILEFCGGLYSSFERQGESSRLVSDIETYIKEHLGEQLSTQGICDLFGISASYLNQLFRKYIKMSFVEFITALRIEEAKGMMTKYPDMPIKDIAAQLGFSDQFYFSKVFKSTTGVPPSEYKTNTPS